MREGQRIGNRAVSRGSSGQPRRTFQICSDHERLDTLVDIAEPFFEAHHRLAAGREAEVARFDNSGMHRSYRDLVQTLSFCR